MRMFDLPMAILLHVVFATIGLSLLGMGVVILGIAAIGSRLSGRRPRSVV